MEVRSITKGANLELPAGLGGLQIVVGWQDASSEQAIDASALLLARGKVRSDDDFVFYNQPTSAEGSVRHLGTSVTEGGIEERIAVDFESVPDDVDAIAITASLDKGSFGELNGLNLLALDDTGAPIVRYDINDATVETAFVFGEVYRRNGGWKLRAVGQGWDTGLAGLATDFGVSVSVEDETAPVPAPDVSELPAPILDETTSVLEETTFVLEETTVVLEETASGLEDTTAVPDEATSVAVPDEATSVAVADEATSVLDGTAATIDETTSVLEEALDEVSEAPAAEPVAAAPPVTREKAVRTRQPRVSKIMPAVPALAGGTNWHAARLFSVAGVGAREEQEKRATSALLATMYAVRPFARGIVARLGGPAGTVETFAEVQFELAEKKVIPDGVIRVARGGRVWTCLLEVKTGTSQLNREQVEKYLDVARNRNYDVVATLSNDIAPGAGEHPVAVDGRKIRKIGLLHLSWAEVLQEARMVLQHRGVETPMQAWILNEFIKYLEHPRSGASGFDDMGLAWTTVREAAAAGTLRANDRKVPAVADAWLRLVRYLCLHLTAELGVTVTSPLPRKLAADPVARQAAVISRLAVERVLGATLKIPGAAGLVTISANLQTRQVKAAIQVDAPTEGTAQRRVSWLLKQLEQAPPDVVVEVGFAGITETTAEKLGDVRARPAILIADRSLDITTFTISRRTRMGLRRSGVKDAFVHSVITALDNFYGTVVQVLKVAPAPVPTLPEESVELP